MMPIVPLPWTMVIVPGSAVTSRVEPDSEAVDSTVRCSNPSTWRLARRGARRAERAALVERKLLSSLFKKRRMGISLAPAEQSWVLETQPAVMVLGHPAPTQRSVRKRALSSPTDFQFFCARSPQLHPVFLGLGRREA